MQNSTQTFDPLKFRQVAEEALVPAAVYIRDVILGRVDLSAFLIKGDKTAVTEVDTKSQKISRPIIQAAFPDYRLNQEEADEETGNLLSNIGIDHDPLDGTGGLLMGWPTPTQILDAFDFTSRRILACATMEPMTGRFWFYSLGNGTFLKSYDYNSKKFDSEEGRPLKVNNQGINGAHVLVDVDHAFERILRPLLKGGNKEMRRVLYAEGRREISRGIEALGAKPASRYTNGGHYADVATGRPTVGACMTTAVGGPFDVAGLGHVLGAGGVGQCYGIKEVDGRREIYSVGEDIRKADIAIAANMPETLALLEGIARKAVEYTN